MTLYARVFREFVCDVYPGNFPSNVATFLASASLLSPGSHKSLRRAVRGSCLEKAAEGIVLIDNDDVVIHLIQRSWQAASSSIPLSLDGSSAIRENLKFMKNSWLLTEAGVDVTLDTLDLSPIYHFFSNLGVGNAPDVFKRMLALGKPCNRCAIKYGVGISNPLVIINLFALHEAADKERFSRVASVALLCHLLCDIDIVTFTGIAGDLTSVVKRLGHEYVPDWLDYCNFEQLLGYNVKDTVGAHEEIIRGWGEGSMLVGSGSVGFDDELVDCMLSSCPVVSTDTRDEFLTFAGFVRSPMLWLTTGSGSRRAGRIVVQSKGREIRVKAKKNRTWWAMGKTSDQIVSDFFSAPFSKFLLKPAKKVELGRKSRDIISAGELLQIGMAYIYWWIAPLFRGAKFSPLFMNAQEQSIMWADFQRRLSEGEGAAFPYDTAAFDQGVGTNEIQCFFRWLEMILERHVSHAEKDWRPVMSRIVEVFFRQPCLIEGKVAFVWGHGVPSGIRWTALMDTVINLGRQEFVARLCRNVIGPIAETHRVAQGDDIALFARNGVICLFWFDLVNWLGYTAHAKKNWISTGRGRQIEFLRKVVSGDRIEGYVMRRLGGTMLRDPTKPLPSTVDEKISERFSGFSILVERGCDAAKCSALMFKSMYSIFDNKVNYASMKSWAHSPKSVGGLGMVPILLSGRATVIAEPSDTGGMPRAGPSGVLREYFDDQISSRPILSLGEHAFQEQMASRLGVVDNKTSSLEQRTLPLPSRLPGRIADVQASASPWCIWTPAPLLDPVMSRAAAMELIMAGYPSQACLHSVAELSSTSGKQLLSTVWSKWSRRLVGALISDKLPRPVPRCLGLSDVEISLASNWILNMTKNRVLSHHRVSYNDFLRYSILVERLCSDWCQMVMHKRMSV